MSKTKKSDEIVSDTAPEIPPPTDAAPPEGKQTIEHWQIVLGTPQWLWAGMKLGKGWPIGKEVTRAEYEAAVDWAANGVVCR